MWGVSLSKNQSSDTFCEIRLRGQVETEHDRLVRKWNTQLGHTSNNEACVQYFSLPDAEIDVPFADEGGHGTGQAGGDRDSGPAR